MCRVSKASLTAAARAGPHPDSALKSTLGVGGVRDRIESGRRGTGLVDGNAVNA